MFSIRLQSKPKPKRDPAEDLFAKEGKRAASGWVPAEYAGNVPEPTEARIAQLERLPDLLRRLASKPSTPADVQQLASIFLQIAAVPPDEPVVLDFSSDLSQALLSDAPMAAAQANELAQLLYVTMNSASLAGRELNALKKEIGALLTAAGGLKDRIQTVLFDIQALNESIKGA